MNKRKKIIISLSVLFFTVVSVMLYYILERQNQKKILLTELQNIPDISFTDINKYSTYRIKDHIGHYSICLIQIDPDCDFCHEQVENVLDKYTLFGDNIILFVSSSPLHKLIAYSDKLMLRKYPNIKFLYDENLIFPKTFGTTTTPTTILYDQDGILLFKHEGFIKVPKIVGYLNGIEAKTTK